jgi:hypothetical protein
MDKRCRLSGMWFEEVISQNRGLKKKFFGLVRNSLQVRDIVREVISLGGSLATATEI